LRVQFGDSLRFYAAALAARPDSAYLRCRLGDLLRAKASFREAATEYSRAIELDSLYSPAWLGRGQALVYLGQPPALDDLSLLVKHAPNVPFYWAARAEAYAYLHQWERALDDYSEALKHRGAVWVWNHSRSEIYAVLGQWEKAANDCEKVTANL